MPTFTDKKALVCRVSKETYDKVMDLVEKGGVKPFESVSEYLMSLIYADLGKRENGSEKYIEERIRDLEVRVKTLEDKN